MQSNNHDQGSVLLVSIYFEYIIPFYENKHGVFNGTCLKAVYITRMHVYNLVVTSIGNNCNINNTRRPTPIGAIYFRCSIRWFTQ